MKNPCTKKCRGNVDCDSSVISKNQCQLAEHLLRHYVIRADIEHIDIAVWMKKKVPYCCDYAADQIDTCAFQIISYGNVLAYCESCIKAKNNQKDMPCKRMNGQWRIVIIHSACITKSKDASQHPKVIKKVRKASYI